jgi:hypothetical protein
MRLLVRLLAFVLCAFIMFAVRLLADAIVLEPHYYRLSQLWLLKGAPFLLLGDLLASFVIVAGVSFLGKSRLLSALIGTVVSVLLIHAGEASLKDLPAIVLVTWVLSAALGALIAAFLSGWIAPPRQAQADLDLTPSA